MRHKRYIFLFILTVSVSLLVIGCVYNVISGKPWYANIMVQFFLNLPLCIGLGFIDFGVINLIYKRLKQRNNAVRILVDIVLTTALAVLLTYILNFLLMGGHGNFWHILRSSLPVVPWNWIIVLQIEIFFYSLQRSEMEKQMAVIEKEKALYQFEVLKSQINPHFLFNSLNVLASLAYQDAEKTNRFAKKLSTVYRYLLTTHGRATVTMQEELARIRDAEKMTMVLVTHDLEEAIYLADRVIILPKIKGDPIRTIEVTLPRPRERSSTDFVLLRQQLMAEFGLH